MKGSYREFEDMYLKAVNRKKEIMSKKGLGDVKMAFPGTTRFFMRNNLNDPLMEIFRGPIFDAIAQEETNDETELKGIVIHNDDTDSLLLTSEGYNFIMSWKEKYAQTSQLYKVTSPEENVKLLDLYQYSLMIGFDLLSKLDSMYR